MNNLSSFCVIMIIGDDMIHLPYTIGKRIRYELFDIYRNNPNLKEPTELGNFNPNEVFLEEELDLITNLRVDKDMLQYIHLFKNIKVLSFDLEHSLSSEELNNVLRMYPKLEVLRIIGQDKLGSIDLSNNTDLWKLEISSNHNLFKITGLEKIRDLSDFNFFNNSSYKFDKGIVLEAIKLVNSASKVELDLLLYPDVLKEITNLGLPKYIEEVLLNEFKWTEVIGGKIDKIVYRDWEAKQIYEEAKKVIDENIKDTDSNIEKFAIIYEWMCQNVKFDETGMNSKNRNHSQNGQKYGQNDGVNGSYNSLIYKECVCEGYTKAMQMLLKLAGIKSFNVACIADDSRFGERGISVNGEKKNRIGDHSILKVNIDGQIYYSDVTWDAMKSQNNQERKYFLLSKEDMMKDHDLLEEDETISFVPSLSKDEFDKLIEFARNRLNGFDDMMKEDNSDTDSKNIVIM